MSDEFKYLILKDGTRISYDVHGTGIPMLMIHGVTDCKETFDSDLKYLTDKFKVYRYDLRGHGRSSHPKEQFDLNDHINDALEVIDSLKLDNFILYGGSLGSYIAEGIAINESNKIKSRILNVSAAHNPASALAKNSKKDKLPNNKIDRRKYWINKLINNKKNYQTIMNSGFQKYPLNSSDEYKAVKSITAFDFTSQLSDIKCPTIITSGKFDSVNPPEKGAVIAHNVRDNKFFEFPSGHLLRLEITSSYWQKILSEMDH